MHSTCCGIVVTVTNCVMGALNDLCSLYSLLCYRDCNGEIVNFKEKFYLVTRYYYFLTKNDACRLKEPKNDNVKQEIKRNCKEVQYTFSTKKNTWPVPAAAVLKNCTDPKLLFMKVGTIALSIEL